MVRSRRSSHNASRAARSDSRRADLGVSYRAPIEQNRHFPARNDSISSDGSRRRRGRLASPPWRVIDPLQCFEHLPAGVPKLLRRGGWIIGQRLNPHLRLPDCRCAGEGIKALFPARSNSRKSMPREEGCRRMRQPNSTKSSADADGSTCESADRRGSRS